jgi:hypothetical protein
MVYLKIDIKFFVEYNIEVQYVVVGGKVYAICGKERWERGFI